MMNKKAKIRELDIKLRKAEADIKSLRWLIDGLEEDICNLYSKLEDANLKIEILENKMASCVKVTVEE